MTQPAQVSGTVAKLCARGVLEEHAKELVSLGCDDQCAEAIVAFPGANILALINLFRQYGPVVMEIIKAIQGIFNPTPANANPPPAASARPV